MKKRMARPTTTLIILPLFSMWMAAGCADDAADDDLLVPVDEGGVVALNWTIGGETDADLCEEFEAQAFEVIVIDRGFAVREFEIPCEEFEGELELVPDEYVIRMSLVDASDVPVTDRIVSSEVTVVEGETETTEVDFPLDSFNEPVGDEDAGM